MTKLRGFNRLSRLILAGAFAVATLSAGLLAGGSGPLSTALDASGLAAEPVEAADFCPPTIRRGARGAVVRELQQRLNAAGGGEKLAVDGVFGPRTEARVGDFQRDHKLANDGVVGPETWGELGACNPPPLKPPLR